MRKLTDTHRTILSSAGARASLLVLPIPKSLKLTREKLETIVTSLLKAELIVERPAEAKEAVWRSDEAVGKLTLVVTPGGLRAVGIEPEPEQSRATVAIEPARKAAPKRTASKSAKDLAKQPSAETKLGQVIAALRSKRGATIVELTAATGWQAHSVRGAISGALKKKLSLSVDSEVVSGRGRVYRIAN